MKTLAKVCIIAAAACILPAPGTAQTERRNFGSENSRREIIFPQVNGMNVYKTDLHTHILPGMDDGAADARRADSHDSRAHEQEDPETGPPVRQSGFLFHRARRILFCQDKREWGAHPPRGPAPPAGCQFFLG